MRVLIRCDECVVEIEVSGGYAPDLAHDVCRRAVEVYRETFQVVEVDAEDDQ